MTVKDLIEKLKNFNENLPVWVEDKKDGRITSASTVKIDYIPCINGPNESCVVIGVFNDNFRRSG